MNDSIKLLVVFMVFWAIIVVLCNLLGQAIAMPEDDKSSMDSPITMGSRFQNSQSNAHSPDDPLSYSNKPLVDLIFMGRGFAMQGNKSHPLFVSIQRIRHIDPMKIRSLMNTNKSLEELKAAIDEQNPEIIYDGDIKLRDRSYQLMNVNVTKLQTGQEIEADLTGSRDAKHDGLNPVKGHIVFIIPGSKAAEASRGELAMNADGLSGIYQVLLGAPQP
jgi:hypothetical protein